MSMNEKPKEDVIEVKESAPKAEHVHGPNCNHDHHHGHGHAVQPFVHESPKLGRNDPCSCGSGKKFKKCCG